MYNNQRSSDFIENHHNDSTKTELNKHFTPENVLKLYSSKLSEYEKKEILNYNHIYFIGNTKEKFNLNNKFDDDNGFYIAKQYDHIAYRYEILKKLASGSFGSVYCVHDHKKNMKLALKIIKNKKEFEKQAFIEIGILKVLKAADKDDNFNFVKIFNHFNFRNHQCILFELLSINLYQLLLKLNSNNNGHLIGVELNLVRRFTYQIVKSLCALSELNILHCDIKPENIVLKEKGKSTIKLIDFGTSCFEKDRSFIYIQSRFYRAPEVICEQKYGLPIDMFSLGCLISELISGKVLFKSKNSLDHLACMMELLGNLPEKLNKSRFFQIKFMKSEYYYKDGEQKYCHKYNYSKPRLAPGTKDPNYLFNECNNSKEAADFVRKCINLDDLKRLKPKEALNHQFLNVKREKVNKILNLIEIIPTNYLNAKETHTQQYFKKLSIN